MWVVKVAAFVLFLYVRLEEELQKGMLSKTKVGDSPSQVDDSPDETEACKIAACKTAAAKLGLTVGGLGFDFEGPYNERGCYAYQGGKYDGHVYYGTPGPQAEKYRPDGYDACTDETEACKIEACKEAAAKLGLTVGGLGFEFEGHYAKRGCYAYKGGKYDGHVYYGTEGHQGQIYQPDGYDACKNIDRDLWFGLCEVSECIWAAKRQNFSIGGKGYNFVGTYATKGCYAYEDGFFGGLAFYSTTGEESVENGTNWKMLRYEDCSRFPNIQIELPDCDILACLAAGIDQSYDIGGKGYKFLGGYATHGCYAYKNGTYDGNIYYSTRGVGEIGTDDEDKIKPIKLDNC